MNWPSEYELQEIERAALEQLALAAEREDIQRSAHRRLYGDAPFVPEPYRADWFAEQILILTAFVRKAQEHAGERVMTAGRSVEV